MHTKKILNSYLLCICEILSRFFGVFASTKCLKYLGEMPCKILKESRLILYIILNFIGSQFVCFQLYKNITGKKSYRYLKKYEHNK